jgi:hypothetical protein
MSPLFQGRGLSTLLSREELCPPNNYEHSNVVYFSKNKIQESSIQKGQGLCRRCGEIKWIYKTETFCEDCWKRAFGELNLYVACPKEKFSTPSWNDISQATLHLKSCYHCPHRKAWSNHNSPLCAFPAPVAVLNTPDGIRSMCPRNLAREGCGVNLELCKICEEHAWIEEDLDDNGCEWVYCSLPRIIKVSTTIR